MSDRRIVAQQLDNPDIDPELTWTTGNIAEAFPGVFTTFGYTFIEEPLEMAFRKMLFRLGVYRADEVCMPDRAEGMSFTVFDGRGVANINKFRDIAGLLPGTSASAVEQQLFGYVRPDTVDDNSRARYAAIAAKAPLLVATMPRNHNRMAVALRSWRLDALARVEGLDRTGCLALLADARRRFEQIMILHFVVSMVSSGLAERVSAILSRLGLSELETAVLSGVGTIENQVAADLWALAHDRITLRGFTDRHGYHGRDEGQLAGVSWREDPSPVLARLEDYRSIDASDPRAPHLRSAQQLAAREQAMAQVRATAPALQRPLVDLVIRAAARFLALREQGKAGYLMTFDVARACTRRLAADLVAAGSLAQINDVFHLSYEALRSDRLNDELGEIIVRRRLFADRQSRRLPQAWAGRPETISVDDLPSGGDTSSLTGVAASPGVVTGRARVVRDPATTELDEGDILVCETTDPSWVALFLVAGGVVTDHGGLLSHGPIVARELGIPCVCGTEVGSRRIQDGQLIRVDGDAGTVEIVAPAVTASG
ncbi:PEP-utilizing protein [Mycobacterium lentiflavum]|uniref:PEP-utilizing protein n=1 Tax=Mycobacterium lentiflavum TaxID=141349 RepID=A0A0E4CPF9_MYCLN|nr:PEP-utilizing enzyme [Mycobacterium lentiflavum]CQD17942.1 PEP-utilizing protein [Mycobacterium lentiflavum]